MRADLLPDARMIIVEPAQLGCSQHFRLDQTPVDWRQCQRLKGVHRLFGTGNLRADYQFEILDPDSVSIGLVITGLVREDHATSKGRRAKLRNPRRAFM